MPPMPTSESVVPVATSVLAQPNVLQHATLRTTTNAAFNALDWNHDGLISREEWHQARLGQAVPIQLGPGALGSGHVSPLQGPSPTFLAKPANVFDVTMASDMSLTPRGQELERSQRSSYFGQPAEPVVTAIETAPSVITAITRTTVPVSQISSVVSPTGPMPLPVSPTMNFGVRCGSWSESQPVHAQHPLLGLPIFEFRREPWDNSAELGPGMGMTSPHMQGLLQSEYTHSPNRHKPASPMRLDAGQLPGPPPPPRMQEAARQENEARIHADRVGNPTMSELSRPELERQIQELCQSQEAMREEITQIRQQVNSNYQDLGEVRREFDAQARVTQARPHGAPLSQYPGAERYPYSEHIDGGDYAIPPTSYGPPPPPHDGHYGALPTMDGSCGYPRALDGPPHLPGPPVDTQFGGQGPPQSTQTMDGGYGSQYVDGPASRPEDNNNNNAHPGDPQGPYPVARAPTSNLASSQPAGVNQNLGYGNISGAISGRIANTISGLSFSNGLDRLRSNLSSVGSSPDKPRAAQS